MVDISNQDDFPAPVKRIKGGMELSKSKRDSMISSMREVKNGELLALRKNFHYKREHKYSQPEVSI